MKKITLISIISMLSFLVAEGLHKKENNLFRINNNIQNEELRSELENLKYEFNIEREKIHNSYQEKIDNLKKARKEEIRSMKDIFSEQRKALMKKYMGKMRDKPTKSKKAKPTKEKMKIKKY